MPIASKLVYFQRRPSPAPPDPGPEPPDPRRRAGRDASSARQRRRSSLSSLHKPGQEPVPGNQREPTKSLGNTAEHVAGTSISPGAGLHRSASDHGRLPDAVQQARERLLQRLNSVDLSGRRQKTCPAETTIWSGLAARPSDFSSDCILGTLTNCFQPGDSIPASKVEEGGTTEEPVCSNADDCTPVPELERSAACRRGTEEGEGECEDRGCEPPASECSICLERCSGGGAEDGRLTRLRCGHVFHSACLDRWLRSHGDCPYCRATVLRP